MFSTVGFTAGIDLRSAASTDLGIIRLGELSTASASSGEKAVVTRAVASIGTIFFANIVRVSFPSLVRFAGSWHLFLSIGFPRVFRLVSHPHSCGTPLFGWRCFGAVLLRPLSERSFPRRRGRPPRHPRAPPVRLRRVWKGCDACAGAVPCNVVADDRSFGWIGAKEGESFRKGNPFPSPLGGIHRSNPRVLGEGNGRGRTGTLPSPLARAAFVDRQGGPYHRERGRRAGGQTGHPRDTSERIVRVPRSHRRGPPPFLPFRWIDPLLSHPFPSRGGCGSRRRWGCICTSLLPPSLTGASAPVGASDPRGPRRRGGQGEGPPPPPHTHTGSPSGLSLSTRFCLRAAASGLCAQVHTRDGGRVRGRKDVERTWMEGWNTRRDRDQEKKETDAEGGGGTGPRPTRRRARTGETNLEADRGCATSILVTMARGDARNAPAEKTSASPREREGKERKCT
eukprot:scaffold739_cov295-Pavlova_lutheri.AAC.2